MSAFSASVSRSEIRALGSPSSARGAGGSGAALGRRDLDPQVVAVEPDGRRPASRGVEQGGGDLVGGRVTPPRATASRIAGSAAAASASAISRVRSSPSAAAA